MITFQDVEHIARLARISLEEHEKAQLCKDLGRVLDWMDQFDALCLQADHALPPLEMTPPRADSYDSVSMDGILSNAPHVEGTFFAVPIIEAMDKQTEGARP